MTRSPLSSLNIIHCISSSRTLAICFILVIICNSYFQGNKLKVLQSENKSIHTCDKFRTHPDLNRSGILGFHYGTKPLQPFDSGDPPICRLEASPSSPIPVILISLGRSGTKVMWQVISRLTGHCLFTQEYTGSNPKDSRSFFSGIKLGNNGNWVLRYLCVQQQKFKEKGGIIGFKWKPHKHSFGKIHEKSNDGLRMIGQYTNPQIKVITSSRNPLDVYLSTLKHHKLSKQKHSGEDSGVKISHCLQDDMECVNAHKSVGSNIHVPLDKLLYHLQKNSRDTEVDLQLKRFNVTHIKVSYEKLFESNDVEEWMRIFRFLGRGPGFHLTKEQVEIAMETVATSNKPSHNVLISNYKEVRDVLKGTEFESLFH